MTVQVTRRCQSCHEPRPNTEFPASLRVEKTNGKSVKRRTYDPYCRECHGNGKASVARRLDRRDAPPRDR